MTKAEADYELFKRGYLLRILDIRLTLFKGKPLRWMKVFPRTEDLTRGNRYNFKKGGTILAR